MGRGVYFSFYPPPVGGKYMNYWLVGGKYEDLLRKNANIRGKRWEKGAKRENFHCIWTFVNLHHSARASLPLNLETVAFVLRTFVQVLKCKVISVKICGVHLLE